jgi:hypothetical protein
VDGPSPYIVTRFVPGKTLDETVRETGPLQGQALEWFAAGLAEALAAINAAGVIHRDLKPGNVMLDRGRPVIIDFGIAHVPDSTRLTKTGLVMGTPGYLAPEVIEGKPSSGASDVHSWGTTVAFAATGRQPFGTGNYQTIFFRVLEGRAELDGVPPRLRAFVTAALATDPASRPPARWLAEQIAAGYANGAGRGGAQNGAGAAGVTVFDTPAPPARPQPGLTRLDDFPLPPNGTAVQGNRPQYRSPAEAARDVADLLPPVDYARQADRSSGLAAPGLLAQLGEPGTTTPGQPGLGQPAPQVRQRPPSILSADPDAPPVTGHGVVTLAAGIGLVALAVLLPFAGTLLALAAMALLRAADMAQAAFDERRTLRGVRPSDVVMVIVTAPLTVVRAVIKTVLLVPLALPAVVIGAGAAVVFGRAGTLPEASSWAAGAGIAWLCIGPGSGPAKRQLGRMTATLIKTRAAMTVAWISSLSLAAAMVSLAASQPPLIWPATSSTLPHLMPALPSLGGTLHSVQGWLLRHTRHTVGMLHLP